MKYKFLNIIIISIITSNGFSQQNFINPFRVGNYCEYLFEESSNSYRCFAKIVKDTIINGKNYVKMDIHNEPPIVYYYLYFSFDSLNLNIFGGENPGCIDSSGNILAIGFNMPIGFIWNECSLGTYFRSKIIEKGAGVGFLNSPDSLNYIIKEDTIGGSIEGTTIYGFHEKFGYSFSIEDMEIL